VSPLLRHGPDPTVRSFLIDRLGPGGVEPRALIGLLDREPEASIRRALILALGEYDRDLLAPLDWERLALRLVKVYEDDPNPGVHAAVGWLLGQWGQQGKLQAIDRALATGKVEGPRRWYVNGQGQTMVIIPAPGEFWMGEGDGRHQRRIDRHFALAAREVTVAEFLRFRREHDYNQATAPTTDCPMSSGLSWYQAAAYCNWLSKEEGIPKEQWCYLPNEKGEYAGGMQAAEGYLQRLGYRLPLEAEWEYACRAGSVTPWSHGAAEDLVGKYGWFLTNSSNRAHPVGGLRPNDLGLFDLHGNAWEWCHDRYEDWGPTGPEVRIEGRGEAEDIKDSDARVMRGGSFLYNPWAGRSANRDYKNVPGYLGRNLGFRPARMIR
jgi:formylglycine-generating enzyme required for sulfatase activity